ncbi:MAG TPA: tolA protein, partial [Pseudobdellovibrionaceae bacterium]
LDKVAQQESDKALQSLLVTNPASAAEFLMENPESLSLVCKTLQDYDTNIKHKAAIKTVMFWGGIAIAGTLLVATGIGGLAVLSGMAAASTLTTVAAGAAIAGTVTAGGEALYSTGEAYGFFAEAQNLRSSAFAEGLTQESLSKADQAKEQVYSELAEAGFSAISILPFAAGIKYIKTAAQASRLGSISKVATEGSKVETDSMRAIAQTLREVSSNDKALKALEKAQKVLKDEEMGTFLGYLSDLSPSEKKKILKLIEQNPEKVPEAIRSSAKTGVCQ